MRPMSLHAISSASLTLADLSIGDRYELEEALVTSVPAESGLKGLFLYRFSSERRWDKIEAKKDTTRQFQKSTYAVSKSDRRVLMTNNHRP